MSSASKAWIVVATVGAVEALKDQGFCRWNHAFRLVQQHVKTNLRSYAQATQHSPPPPPAGQRDRKSKQSEESLRTVMYLSSWGPN